MTTLGKILVFLNLVGSLLLGALIVMWFTNHTPWPKGWEEERTQRKKDHASYLAAEADKVRLEQENSEQREKDLNLVRKVSDDLKAAETKLKAAEDRRQEAIIERDKVVAANQNLTATVDAVKKEAELANKQQAAAQKQVGELLDQTRQLTKDKTEANIKFESAQARLDSLLKQLEQSVKDNETLRGRRASEGLAGASFPPPDDVKGRVKAVDASGLLTINLGSDSGVNKGNTLEVFRLKPMPTYVGTVQILESRPHEAVGKLIGAQQRSRVEVGDDVASHILGKP